MLKLPVYMDHNATTPCDPEVVKAMLPYFTEQFGNAASHNHSFGWLAREAVDLAREQVASLIGAEKNEIVFTSGATESINLALKGVYEMYSGKGNHIISSNIEHKAVLDTCRRLEEKGTEVTYLEAEHNGFINLKELENSFRPETVLLSIMYANNETGTILPVKAISEAAKKRKVIFFTDATQAVGKIPVDVHADGIDLMAFNAHKIYGPKGVGALYIRRKDPRVKLFPQIDGGGHEKGIRSGTLNVPGIVGFGKACEIAGRKMKEDAARLLTLRDKLENSLLKVEETYRNGSKESRLPHVSNLAFKYTEGAALLRGITKDIAVSSGSACTSALPEPSHVLKAMGLGDELAHSSIRFSLGRNTTDEEIDFVIQKVTDTVNLLRKESPVWKMFKEGNAMHASEWAHRQVL